MFRPADNRIHRAVSAVTADSQGAEFYFPEEYLSLWFRQALGEDVSCFPKPGYKELQEAHACLVDHLKVDTIILADGGSDSLLRGDEQGLGTPLEDMTSIAAIHWLEAAAMFVFQKMPQFRSIVCSSVIDALAGNYGNHHSNVRTKGSTLWINPLMTFYWCFGLTPLAERVMYLDKIRGTTNLAEAAKAIGNFRSECENLKGWTSIPL